MSEIVKQGQSILDLAVQYYGTVEGVMDIAIKNGISITDSLVAGSEFIISPVNNLTAKYIKDKGIVVATGHEIQQPQGIGYWNIGGQFIVD